MVDDDQDAGDDRMRTQRYPSFFGMPAVQPGQMLVGVTQQDMGALDERHAVTLAVGNILGGIEGKPERHKKTVIQLHSMATSGRNG